MGLSCELRLQLPEKVMFSGLFESTDPWQYWTSVEAFERACAVQRDGAHFLKAFEHSTSLLVVMSWMLISSNITGESMPCSAVCMPMRTLSDGKHSYQQMADENVVRDAR